MSTTNQSRSQVKAKSMHRRLHKHTLPDEERLYQIILKPVVSEKSTLLSDKYSQAVFQVRTDASKDEVRQAVEKLFEVKVKSVQIANVRGKMKNFGRVSGMRSSWKKAYVCLHEGQDMDLIGGMTAA